MSCASCGSCAVRACQGIKIRARRAGRIVKIVNKIVA
jgi:hypothetical protein